MTIIQAAKYLEQIALSSPYIRTTKEGSVYDIMNTNGKIKYGVFVLSQTQHRQDDLFDYIGFNAFVIDRLDDDLESNRLQIQSTAKEVLANIVLTFKNRFYGSTFDSLVFHPFTEKFTDLCAGQYCQLNIRVPRTLICEDSYGELTHNYELVPLVVTITENGVKEYKPETFDAEGFDNVTIRVNVDNSGSYYSGYTSGYTDGYISGTTDGYSSGKTDGIEEQKAKLISTSITENGVYEREDGFSSIEVNVDTGITINNQTKSISITENGTSAITYDNGFTGLEAVNIEVNVPQTGYTQQDLDNAYQSGVTSGVTQQKSKLVATAFTENGNYTKADGYSAVTVNVPTQNYWNSGFTSGYTVGYSSGKTDGVAEQKAKLTSTAITENGTYTRTDGYNSIEVNVPIQDYWNSGYTSGYTDGFSSGYTQAEKDMEDRFTYLTFVIEETGNIVWGCVGNLSKTIYYSKNGGEWTSITSSPTGENISVVSGDIVRFRGDNSTYGNQYNGYSSFRCGSLRYKIYGNPNSLIDSCQFGNLTSLTDTYTFSQLFYNNTGLDIADNHNLYLSATGLTQNCYDGMFMLCTSLTKAPILPAKTLVENCYSRMFGYCTSLIYIKCLATTLGNSSTYQWLTSASSTGTFVKAKNVIWSRNNNGIPNGWTVIEE